MLPTGGPALRVVRGAPAPQKAQVFWLMQIILLRWKGQVFPSARNSTCLKEIGLSCWIRLGNLKMYHYLFVHFTFIACDLTC